VRNRYRWMEKRPWMRLSVSAISTLSAISLPAYGHFLGGVVYRVVGGVVPGVEHRLFFFLSQ
jgi:hypothetical protein